MALDYTYGEIKCMYKSVKKNKLIGKYMDALALHNGYPTVHWEDNTIYISSVEYKVVTHIVKHIGIPL